MAERTVAIWQQQMEDTIIRAPFAGIVTSKNAQPGEMISPMSAGGGFTRTGICTIVDMESLEIEIDVNESYINRVEPGQPVEATLDAYPGLEDSLQGDRHHPDRRPPEIHRQGPRGFRQAGPAHPAGDERQGGVSRKRQAPGASGGRCRAGAQGGASSSRTGSDVVLVVQDGRAERRAVTVSSSTMTMSSVSAGLAAGEKRRVGLAHRT